MKNLKDTTHAHNATRNKQAMTGRHLVKLFIVYLIVTGALAGWINYSSYETLNTIWMAVAALAAAIILTAIHRYNGRRNRLDDLADGDL